MLNRSVLCLEFTYPPSLELHRLVKRKCYFHFSPIMLYSHVERRKLQRVNHAVTCMIIKSIICLTFYNNIFKLFRKI